MITVSILDDHPVILNGIAQMLTETSEFRILGTHLDYLGLMKSFRIEIPDILLLDIQMPDIRGNEVAKTLLAEYDDMKIIALTNYESYYYFRTMLQSGVRGYLLKTVTEAILHEALRQVFAGSTFIDPSLPFEMESFDPEADSRNYTNLGLTLREKEVAKLLASGYTNEQISGKLFLSYNTVRNHRARIFLKLGVKTIAELINRL
jgi:DNA-binding NarL/FixJ family response regulator